MIRRFAKEDTDVVVASWRSASALAHPFLSQAFIDREAENVRNVYLALAETWVTEVDGEVVGFISLIEDMVGGLFLDPAYHGRGYGRAMLDKAVAEKGALQVEVFEENAIARRFYTAYGFQGAEEFTHELSGQPTLRMTFKPS
ncbi:GNAT family N-acetyltransferase [Denitrobaculum tricleocarpae]|uniref:GNAT family N-acetyltransferase n=1 Tax=Denitrobaculum tricleocarpae TaxID=2591009 RepID=A0A545TYI7_9PROT|nr:GNAT family N-acetyltransferase [Denitrobaculum tricleocarpae]TQV82261.1 GNAT family N-acetyltransferase [Denitrobaculum tricleocarpae]